MTQRQIDLLDFLKAYIAEHRGLVPSFAEMMVGINCKSKSTIAEILNGLEKRGKIERLRRCNRAIKLL